MAIKRVVALEGDTVVTKAPYPFATETVPTGHVWVEGEHPESDRWSNDSNHYGPVSWRAETGSSGWCARGLMLMLNGGGS